MTKFYHGGLKEIIIPKRLLTLLHGVMYGFSAIVMNAHLDWWYGQIFCNELIEFKYTHDMGIGAFARVPGTCDSLSEGLFGCLEFITEI